ncbi:alpha-mannosidase [Rhizobium sp. R72]|uniref:alpha-mannosidase n=1 Tax=unclassified Rhizobium TaxID=2613769 RepID=UPI000B529B93|nr:MULTISPECIES: glycoside hydrolase family 38 C-terminal domain-containing protein [unclassified Rhizobium]OWW04075.1 alpha-mannosidase [Rhizobium sp. R72]OWW04278.1 alpha-mannosidase [Rhizobium sp. R711]
MTLTLHQRLERLRVRTAELEYWRSRETVEIDGWTFDDEPIAIGAPWPRSDGIVRFAAFARLPDHWPLDDARLSLDLGGESLIAITDEAGNEKRLGLDPYHREFPLASRTIAIASETVARLPFGEPVRGPKLERALLIWLDTAVDNLWLLLRQVCEAIDSLKQHEVVPHLLDIAEETMRSLEWPSSTTAYVARTATSPMQQKIWQLPPLEASPEGLNQAERASVIEAYETLIEQLKKLRERYPPEGEIALTGHAHIDLAWLWPYGETRRKMRRTFHTALSLMEQSPDFRFNQSTAHYYAQIAQDDPALLERIVERARHGQWETIGGMWVEPDTNMPTGESLSRQILYGQRYFEKTFGVRHSVCWLPDCFGFSGALPQLLRQGGMNSFFTIKVNWSETNKFPSDLFWWEGLDGSRVLTHTFDNPMHGYNGFVRPDCFVPTWRNFKDKDKHDTTLLAVGYGDGGGGVTPEMIVREEQLRVFPTLPKARWSKVHDFFKGAHERAKEKDLATWRGEIYLELHRATLTSQSVVKRLHRKAERSLITAETLSGLAHLMGAKQPRSMEPEWRVVLKNEFHDILPGSSIAEVYVDAANELEAVISAGKTAQNKAMEEITAQLPAGSGDNLLVVNPSLSARPLRLTLPDGRKVSCETAIAPLGIAVVSPQALLPASGLAVSTGHLENAVLKVTLAKNGSIASLVHKATGREALEGGGNRLFVYPVDKPRNWDAWDVEEDYGARKEEITALDSLDVIENGPHRIAIRIVRTWRHSRITQVLSLGANSRRLDIETELDWHDRRAFLRTETSVAVRNGRATYECAYGVVERPTHSNTSWDAAMFEAPAHRFADLSEPGFGVAILNDAKYGHSVRDNVLGLSLLRSPIYPDPLADEGLQSFTYALMPHEGTWYDGGVRDEAEDLNQPLLATPVKGRATGSWQPLGISGIEAALSAIKPAEEGDGLIVRVYEPAGRRGALELKLPSNWRNQGPVSILEEPLSDVQATALRPFEVKSWRLSRA